MSRPKKKTIAELEAERDKLNKRIATARKAEQDKLDKATLEAVRRWAATYRGGQKPEDLPALFNAWAKSNTTAQK